LLHEGSVLRAPAEGDAMDLVRFALACCAPLASGCCRFCNAVCKILLKSGHDSSAQK
jgi:hypothetical protein